MIRAVFHRLVFQLFNGGRAPSHAIDRCHPIVGGDRGRVVWWCVTFKENAQFAGNWRRIPRVEVNTFPSEPSISTPGWRVKL